MEENNIIEKYKERLISNFEKITEEVDGNTTLLPIGEIIKLIRVTE